MGYFSNLTARLGIDISPFNKGLKAASTASNRFAKQVAKDFKNTGSSASSAANNLKVFSNAADKGYKSVKRIAQGIMFSQAFYRTIHAIKSGTSAMYEFSQIVEESRVAFAGLIGDLESSIQFNRMLQDLAADTPFTYEQAADNARKLLAYEFKLESMERVMRSIADATAASGKIESYSNITAALGQIQAKGRLTARELIRLANAGIPAYQILREELGLTHEQITNLGKAHITAGEAIPAILRGMEKRYAGAAAAMQRTTKGLTNAIRENVLIIGQELFDPIYSSWRGTMQKISDSIEAMRDRMREGGIGGMLESTFSPRTVQNIRLLASNIQMLIQNIVGLYRAFAPVRHAVTNLFITVFNMVMPFINAFGRIIVAITQLMVRFSTATRILTTILATLLILGPVTKLVIGFTRAIKNMFIVKMAAQLVVSLAKAIGMLTAAMLTNPFIAFATIATGAVVAMAATSKRFRGVVNKLSSSINKVFGSDPSKIFKPKMEDNTEATESFNKALDVSSEGLDKIGDAAKRAGKKAKEALMTFDEVFVISDDIDAGSGSGGLDDMFDFSDVEMPSIPPFDISELFPDVTNPLTEWAGGVADKIADILPRAIAGAGIGAAIGAAIGGAFGGPAGAVLGAKIGAFVGAGVGIAWPIIKEKLSWLDGKLVEWSGGILRYLADKLIEWDEKLSGWITGSMTKFNEWYGKNLNGFLDWFFEIDEAFFEWSRNTLKTVDGWIINTIRGFADWFFETDEGFFGWQKNNLEIFDGWSRNGFEKVREWANNTAKAYDEWIINTIRGFADWFFETDEGFYDWAKGTFKGLIGWGSDTLSGLSGWWEETKLGFSNWVADTGETFKDGLDTKLRDIGDWAIDTGIRLGGWVSDTGTRFREWSVTTAETVRGWASNTGERISGWWGTTRTGFSGWWTSTGNGISSWASNSIKSIRGWASETYNGLSTWWANSKLNFSNWFKDTSGGFVGWARGIYESVLGWFDSLGRKLQDFFDKLKFWKKDAEKGNQPTVKISGGRSGSGSGGIVAYSMSPVTIGHAKGGVFNKEHIAKFSEGNKIEAIFPVENPSAMAKVRKAIFGGEPAEMFAALVGEGNRSEPVTPIYVYNLIADDGGIKKLEDKLFEVRQLDARRGGNHV